MEQSMSIDQLFGIYGTGQVSGVRSSTRPADAYARNSDASTGSSAAPSSWGPDMVSVSVYAREQLDSLLKNEDATLPEQKSCYLTVGNKRINITECLNTYMQNNPEDYDILNGFTHKGPEGLVKALSLISGIDENEIKNALQGMNAGQSSEFAAALGEMLGVPPSIFKESLTALTSITEELLEQRLRAMLGTDYREAEAIDA